MAFSSNHANDMLIRKLDSIANLSDEERQAVEHLHLTGRYLNANQDIVCDNDSPSQCCLIIEGWLFRYKLLDKGKRQIFSFHVPGDIPDIQSLHLSIIDHNICTLTPATVAFISHEAMRELTAAFPGIAATLWRDTLVDAAIFRQWMVGMGRRTACEAMAHLFCELYVKLEAVGLASGYRFTLPATQVDVGDALGLSNVHVNRVLRELRERELVVLRSGKLEILDWQELAKMCDFDPTYLQLQRRHL